MINFVARHLLQNQKDDYRVTQSSYLVHKFIESPQICTKRAHNLQLCPSKLCVVPGVARTHAVPPVLADSTDTTACSRLIPTRLVVPSDPAVPARKATGVGCVLALVYKLIIFLTSLKHQVKTEGEKSVVLYHI